MTRPGPFGTRLRFDTVTASADGYATLATLGNVPVADAATVPVGATVAVVQDDHAAVVVGVVRGPGGTPVTPPGGVSDHGALTGLADNDHPQYALTAHTHGMRSVARRCNTTTLDTVMTALAWDVAAGTTQDPAMWVAGTPTRLIAPVAGLYLITCAVRMDNVVGSGGNAMWGRGQTEVALNGTRHHLGVLLLGMAGNTAMFGTHGHALRLAAGDYLEVRASRVDASAGTVANTTTVTFVYLGP